ncbi:MFS transporter [Metarhizium rileyi]|uniref:MFS transporter n=1 Tax=Metarhizium rileyi (strain RCEF 4871) TaxID=1649241 RepID=A0A162LS13_METRR|nr:MFS transporter [Metarhizium rileyi RCEF 4871]
MKINVDGWAVEEMERAEDGVNAEVLPGTEIMVDAGKGGFDRDRTTLVPQASDSPDDPLNWSPFWKGSAIFAASCATFTQGFSVLAVAPMFPVLMDEFNRPLSDVIKFTGVTIIALGFSNFFWVPMSTSNGRRVVLILSQTICLISYIWRARSTSYGSFMGSIILNGIGAGPSETLQPSVVADLFFLEARGKWNTLYWALGMGSAMISPVISGIMTDRAGWQSFYYLSAALTVFSLMTILFGFPETTWHRGQKRVDGGNKAWAEIITEIRVEEATRTDLSPPRSYVGIGKPSRTQWRVFQLTPLTWKSIRHELWMPWKLFSFPIVLFASLVISWSCSGLLLVNLTQSQVFSSAPYNWSAESVGYTNLALLAGVIIGLLTAGPFSDWVCARATARNGGIREAEMRLPAMIPYVLLMIAGHIIPAMGYQQQWSWGPIVMIGYACAGIQVAGIPGIVSTYAVDSYKTVAGPLFVGISISKNMWGYGMSEFVTRWTEQAGFLPVFMMNMGLSIFLCSLGIVFYYHGKTFRRWTSQSSVHKE